MSYAQSISLVCLSGVAAVSDLRKGRIDNRLILTGYLLGLFAQIWSYGIAGVPLALAGALLPLLLLWVLYAFRMIGAGDVKLFSALGALMGPTAVFSCILYSFLIGGCLSAVLLLRRHNLRRRLQYFFAYFSEYSATGQWKPYLDKTDKSSQLHFTVPVFLSVLLQVWQALT